MAERGDMSTNGGGKRRSEDAIKRAVDVVVGQKLAGLRSEMRSEFTANAMQQAAKVAARAEVQLKVKALEDRLDTKFQEAVDSAVAEKLKELGKREPRKLAAARRYVWILGGFTFGLAVIGVVLFWLLPNDHKVKESAGYLAYILPLFGAIAAGRGLLVTSSDAKAEEQAAIAFMSSLALLGAGAGCQVAFQLGEQEFPLYAGSMSVGLMLCIAIGIEICYQKYRLWIKALVCGLILTAMLGVGIWLTPTTIDLFQTYKANQVVEKAKQEQDAREKEDQKKRARFMMRVPMGGKSVGNKSGASSAVGE